MGIRSKISLIIVLGLMLCQSNATFAGEVINETGIVGAYEPIEGLEGCYILKTDTYQYIVDENGNNIVDTTFRLVSDKLGANDTLLVYYPEGMADLSAGLLDKNLNVIVPRDFYMNIYFIDLGGTQYVSVQSFGGANFYYDMSGNLIEDAQKIEEISKNKCSEWAQQSIGNAIYEGIVPQDLECKYTEKITRKEFCYLAVETYCATTGATVDLKQKTPFSDIDDAYVTMAYNNSIVAGAGEGKFAPDSYITRQEAAVMLNNLAEVLGINNETPRTDKFIDESYFADWATKSIYSVAGIRSEYTYVMAGTEENKFSPWMNFTREQAISTMLRLYNCMAE